SFERIGFQPTHSRFDTRVEVFDATDVLRIGEFADQIADLCVVTVGRLLRATSFVIVSHLQSPRSPAIAHRSVARMGASDLNYRHRGGTHFIWRRGAIPARLRAPLSPDLKRYF